MSPRDRRKANRFKKLRKLKGSGTKKLQDSQKSSSRFKSNRKFQERRASSAELSARYTARSRWTCSVVRESSLMLGAGPSVFQLPLRHQHRSKFIGSLSWTRAELFLQSVIPAPPRGSRHFFKPSKEKKITQQLSIKRCHGRQRVLNQALTLHYGN